MISGMKGRGSEKCINVWQTVLKPRLLPGMGRFAANHRWILLVNGFPVVFPATHCLLDSRCGECISSGLIAQTIKSCIFSKGERGFMWPGSCKFFPQNTGPTLWKTIGTTRENVAGSWVGRGCTKNRQRGDSGADPVCAWRAAHGGILLRPSAPCVRLLFVRPIDFGGDCPYTQSSAGLTGTSGHAGRF